MRGKVFKLHISFLPIRITPAYAGKSGEKVGDAIGGTGSPPPMRGKVISHLPSIVNKGITPAYAGKSFRNFITIV